MTLLDLLNQDGISIKRVSSTNGGEYAGPCPACGGEDRFRVWPEQGDGGRFWCRGCGLKGDSIQYLRDFRKLSYREACRILDREPRMNQPLSRNRSRNPSATWQAKVAPLPGDQWAQRAGKFLAWAEQQLWTTDQGKEAVEWLHGRGLTDETIKRFRLGWNSQDWFPSRSAFGLPVELKKNGRPKKLFLPLGLVIPKIINGHVLRIRIRRPERKGDDKYRLLSGSETGPLIIPGGPACVVVESELDAILMHQDAGDLATMIALGSAQIRTDQATAVILDRAEVILSSLDSDDPGVKEAWQWWARHYPKSKRWPCIGGKDPSEAKQNGLDLRAWVVAGLLPPAGEPDAAKRAPENVDRNGAQSGLADVQPYPPNQEFNVQSAITEAVLPSSTEDPPEVEEWQPPYPYSCRDCFHAAAGCQRPERIQWGLQCLHDCANFLKKGQSS